MDALGVCMHKTLRIIYGMPKNNKPFDPKNDIANRQRSALRKKNTPKKNTNRRFQDYDRKAPVTRRQLKIRLERERSQSVINTKPGITAPVPLGDIIANILGKI